MDSYFSGREATFPERAPVGRRRIVRHILRARGSAPGVDQEPYELYHYGVRFVAALLAQVFHAAGVDDGGHLLARVLGHSIDLLAWIPKGPGTQQADGVRGLQLPTCMRRLFGAVLVETAAPPVEACLTAQQAGIRGRHCGENVRRCFRHLAGARDGGPVLVGPLWEQVLGALADPCWEVVCGTEEGSLHDMPALLSEDQAKAF